MSGIETEALPVLQAVLSGILVGGVYGLRVDRSQFRLWRDAHRQFRAWRPGDVRHVCRRGGFDGVRHRSAAGAPDQLPADGDFGCAAISRRVPPLRRPHHPQPAAGGDRPAGWCCKWWRSSSSESTRAAPRRSSPAATIWSGRSSCPGADRRFRHRRRRDDRSSSCCCARRVGQGGARRGGQYRGRGDRRAEVAAHQSDARSR